MSSTFAEIDKYHGSRLTIVRYQRGFSWLTKNRGFYGFCLDMKTSNEVPVGRPAMELSFRLECNRLALLESDKRSKGKVQHTKTVETELSEAINQVSTTPSTTSL